LGRPGRGHTGGGDVLVAGWRFQVARRDAVTRKEEEGAGPACELELASMENTYRSGREQRIHSRNSMEKQGKRLESSPGVRVCARRGRG
jgi:hypothetical protein